MRLAVEITTCARLRTGVGYYVEHIVDALLATRRPGDEVVLLSNHLPAPELAERWAPHLHVRGPGVRALWMQSAVPALLDDTGADAALFPNYAVPLAAPCPTITIVHDLAILRTPQHFTFRKRVLMRAMLRHAIAAASIVGTVSEASRRDILALLNIPGERVAVFRAAAHPSCRPAPAHAVDEVRARHGLHRRYVLAVGTLEPRKNLPTLLRAFDRLDAATAACDLVVVGPRGWLDAPLVRQLRARARSERVRWLGYVPESDLVALYTGAELLALASTLEGFGLPLLEAMACGTPVVASDVAALREVGGDVPTFVPPTDEAAFARAIATALADKSRMAAARAAGLAHARRFSWHATAEEIWSTARRVAPERVRAAASPKGTAARETAAASPKGTAARETPAAPEAIDPVGQPPPALDAREWALLAAVVYADLFDAPLPIEEATRRSPGVATDEAELRRLIGGPHLRRLITLHASGYLALAGREHLVEAMPQSIAVTRELLERNGRMLRALAALPFVRSIVLSGGVAHRNPGKHPDVDLFVVAARTHAYTAYSMLFLATKLAGSRRMICPNYLVDEDELAIAYHRDLFTAHQLVSSRPYSGHSAYEALCRANEEWVRSLFPSFAPHTSSLDDGLESPRSPNGRGDWTAGAALQRAGELALTATAGVVERCLRFGWRMRLRRRAVGVRASGVVLGRGILKLHLSDYRQRTLERFAARLAQLRAELQDVQSDSPSVDPVGT
jgi:glycosyltransferase involved in cell wall biosynthesis